MENSNEFFTKDLNEASALLVSGVKLLRLERGQGHYWFVFEKEGTQEISIKFWNGDLLVDAQKYSDAIRKLKDRLFAQR